jgi:hypothetical protein
MTSVNSATLEERLLDCFPSGSYALAALLRLVDIVPTEAIPTAASSPASRKDDPHSNAS